MEPAEMTLQQLRDMTNGFSAVREIGSGAFGTVYWGKDESGQEVAVKLLRNYVAPELSDRDFKNELSNLKKLNHPHIVKLIGYCYEIEKKFVEHKGNKVLADEIYRAFCLEYLHNGSLDDFLFDSVSDGRLDWHACFKIIKGSCEGLKYLHEGFAEPIYHLDLKPENILLDINMVPKLADFGLSRIFLEEKTKITTTLKGTLVYMPPEYKDNGEISNKFDVFSMGVVMIKTISGKKGRSKSAEMPPEEFIKLVLDSWRVKLQQKWSGSSLEAYCQQVKRCTEMALECIKDDRHKRPKIKDIVHELRELETAADKISGCPGGELLNAVFLSSVDKLKRQMIECNLTNNTDDDIEFRLRHGDSPREMYIGQMFGLVAPRETISIVLHQPRNAKMHNFFALGYWTKKQEEVNQVKLVARYDSQGPGAQDFIYTISGGGRSFKILHDRMRVSMDVHPTEPWILQVQHTGIYIHNCKTQETYSVTKREYPGFTVAKFAARKKLIIAGDRAGTIHVYSYDDPKGIIECIYQAHSSTIVSLAIHPAKHYVLSASDAGYIKLWKFRNAWQVKKVFGNTIVPGQSELHVNRHLVFHPKHASIFASVQNNGMKIWNRNFGDDCTFISAPTAEENLNLLCWDKQPFKDPWRPEPVTLTMNCLNYFRRDLTVFLIGGFSMGVIKVWDFGSKECVKRFHTPNRGNVRAVCSHPDLPILITGSDDGTICLWDSTNFKLVRTMSFGLGTVRALGCLKGSRRVLIGHDGGIAVTEIAREETGAST